MSPAGKTNSQLLKVALIAASTVGTIGLAGYGLSRILREPATDDGAPSGNSQTVDAGFAMGSLAPTDPIETIKITIEAAPGAPITEVVDLHLGFGFPLRLSPSTSGQMKPVFAALPSDSSLGTDAKAVPAGEPVWFQFDQSDQTSDRDPLKTSHTLLSGLTVGDISQIGFASGGVSDWTLAKYKIELNGQLYAANGSFNKSLKQVIQQYQFKVKELMAKNDVLAGKVDELTTIVEAGLGTEAEEKILAENKAELAGLVEPLRRMGGQLLGQFPAVVETESSFQPVVPTDRVASIRLAMLAGGDEQPGTVNPLYFRAGGRKFLLASELAPLADAPNEQVFELSPVDLSFDPVSRSDLNNFSIGLLGSNQPLSQQPDSAKLQRVSLEVDGKNVYTSEPIQSDRQSLERVLLVPPAHRDEQGQVVVNPSNDFDRYAWNPGLKIPQARPTAAQQDPGRGSGSGEAGANTAGAGLANNGSTPSPGTAESGPAVTRTSGAGPGSGKTNGPAEAAVATASGAGKSEPDASGPDASEPDASDADSNLVSRGAGSSGANGSGEGMDTGKGSRPGSNVAGTSPGGSSPGGSGAAGGGLGLAGGGGGGSIPPGMGSPGPSPGSSRNPSPNQTASAGNPNVPDTIETLVGSLLAALGNRAGNATPPDPTGLGSTPGVSNPPVNGASGAGANGNAPNTATPTVIPAPKKLQISQVRFNYRYLSVPADGSPCTVDWEVENSQDVKEFQVRLWGRLPHRGSQVPVLIAESQRIENRIASGSGVFRSAPLPEIDLAKTFLPSSEYHRAFVEPEVIAFDRDGNMIAQGGAAKGPMLPLLTKSSQLNQQPFVIGRDPSIQLSRQSSVERQFQIDGDGYDAPASVIPWNSFASQPTYDGKSVWIANTPTNSHNAFTFEESSLSPMVGVSVWDPNVGQLTVRFDNQVRLDANYRLVAHLGIMNGNATTDNQVEIDARLIVQDISGSKGGIYEPDELAGTPSAAEVLRIETTRTVTYDKQGARTPMFLIDIPIACDLDYAAYNSELFETASVGTSTLTDMEVDKNFEQSLPIGSIDKAFVSLTLMLKLANRVDNEAIGLFGLRLVQDPDQRPLPPNGGTAPVTPTTPPITPPSPPPVDTPPPPNSIAKDAIIGRWARVAEAARTVFHFRDDGTYDSVFEKRDGETWMLENGSWTLDRGEMMTLTPTKTDDPNSTPNVAKETKASIVDDQTLFLGLAGRLTRFDLSKALPPIPVDASLLPGTWERTVKNTISPQSGLTTTHTSAVRFIVNEDSTFSLASGFGLGFNGNNAPIIWQSDQNGSWIIDEGNLVLAFHAQGSQAASDSTNRIGVLSAQQLVLSPTLGIFTRKAAARTQQPVPKSNTPEIDAFLKVHNDARAAVGAGIAPLRWSAELAADAQIWADELKERNSGLTHRNLNVPPSSIEYRTYGENLYRGSTQGNASPAKAAEAWLSERKDYENSTGRETGHYTQMVWANTTHTGFGIAIASDGNVYVVGVYDPPGNYGGEKPYTMPVP